MMSILITGASGYLGGSLLAQLHDEALPSNATIYALVRNKVQEDAVKTYGALPLYLDLDDEEKVLKSITDAKIGIVFYLIDAVNHGRQLLLIKALAEVRRLYGTNVHFLHTTGAKIFSEHAGLPTDYPISDKSPDLFELSKASQAPVIHAMNAANESNNTIIDSADAHGVRSYIFIPCIVYGEGTGFGNKISIQTVAIVKAAKGCRRVYDVNPPGAAWPVCHISDNTALYAHLLQKMLAGDDIGYGKNGYYLASSGAIGWHELYTEMAKALAAKGAVDDEIVKPADDNALAKMGEALGCPKEAVRLQLGGRCSLQPEHGVEIGWKAEYPPKHILEAADAEVQLILENLTG